MKKRLLYLIPATLGDERIDKVIPSYNLQIISSLTHFIVEDVKSARRFLIKCGIRHKLEDLHFYELNEHTDITIIPDILTESGSNDLGAISEAGLPAVADPGAQLVKEAFRNNIQVVPLAGPSSIFMALMASGLNGQCFAFNGYLPVNSNKRDQAIRLLEKKSRQENQSQIFIETPYRNNKLITALIDQCKTETLLCIASNITLPNEWIKTKSIREWKLSPPPDLKKQPTVYIIQA